MRALTAPAAPPDADAERNTDGAADLARWLAPVSAGSWPDGPEGDAPRCRGFGYLRLLDWQAAPAQLSRTPRTVLREPLDAVAVVLPRHGTASVTQDGRGATVGAGELTLIDLRRPFALERAPGASVLLCRLPAHALGLSMAALRPVLGRVVPVGGDGVAGLLGPLLHGLGASTDTMPVPVGERLGGVVTEFVAALVNEWTEEPQEGNGPACPGREALLRSVREHIDRHLGDPDLSPERIAAAHGISVRYLHRLFEAEDITVGRLVHQRRVEQCERELSRRGRVSPSISAVAQRWGFRSPAHFSRAFKAVYGHSPRQWRAAALDAADSPPPPPRA
ncbi:helix-turn-helix domain-containing protein [Streptomyces sp. NBC_01426]|uniref:helix-turn-helix domain-containing protein n=1 Tax=unclassified Streptomyces TaxID=2593676 RepID=UPI002E3557B7|nr:helix-turn-helix domain-containing protein [Streptomyces sp. NBC_01426]